MPSINEEIADLAREHAIDLSRLTAQSQDRVVALLRRMLRELRRQLSDEDWEQFSDPTFQATMLSFSDRRFLRRIKIILNTVDETYRAIRAEMKGRLIDLSDYELEQIKDISDAIPVKIDLDTITPGEAHQIARHDLFQGKHLDSFWGDQAENVKRSITEHIRDGIAHGQTNQQIRDRIVGPLNRATTPTGEVPALNDKIVREANTVVRTSVQEVAHRVRMDTYKRSKLVKGVQFHATFDERTTLGCRARDGLVWMFDEDNNLKPHNHKFPWEDIPRHPNCRSDVSAVVKSWRELGIDADEIPPSTKASMDGQIAATKTMDEWLREKAEQPNRIKQRRGKDVLDRNGNPVYASGPKFVEQTLGVKRARDFLENENKKLRDYFDSDGNLR